jgi:hypothetical protein
MEVTRRLSLSSEVPSPADLAKLHFHEIDLTQPQAMADFVQVLFNKAVDIPLTAAEKRRPEIMRSAWNVTKLRQDEVLKTIIAFPQLLELKALQFCTLRDVSALRPDYRLNLAAVAKAPILNEVNLDADFMPEGMLQHLAKIFYTHCKSQGEASVDSRLVL